MWKCIRQIARATRRVRANLVLSWMGKAHLYGGPAAALAGVPAAWFQHGIPNQRNGMDVLTALVPAAGVLTCSRTSAEGQLRLWPRRRVRVVYPPVDLQRFDPERMPAPAQMRRQLGLRDDGPLIGIVGRLQRWKGFHVLIAAMPSILERHPRARCVLVGGEHAKEADYPVVLRRQIAALNLEGHVSMVGLQTNVPQWMQAMDVVVHASEAEPFGMVVIEAMALGKPVVASAAAGPTEVVTPGMDGLLAPYGDAHALSAAVTKYLDDPIFAESCGRAARARARGFSAGRFAAEVTSFATEIAGRHSPDVCVAAGSGTWTFDVAG
jgi:glycosyltransferase involved in cell wall biosynthesis